jgi:2-polyprenyl-3-methyl-5-hydroxy-6-metoxy-1,4-benzoquinol methylase
MQKIPDWNSLWRELVEIKARSRQSKNGRASSEDVWEGRAIEYKEGVKRRWECPDSSRQFILSQVDPDATFLDIGAGTGSWSILMAGNAKHVTAVEPSSAMIEVLRESLAAESITNVSVVQGLWPDVTVGPHDFSLCSHAMYGTPDLAAFILKMASVTRRMCFLILRAAALDGIRAEAARHIWKQPLDSPNFTIAYNVLIQAGIFANVLMENTGFWKPKISPSLEEALSSMKRYLALGESAEHDAYLMDLLERRLTWDGSKYLWPPDVRSALIYWRTDAG